MPAHPGCRRPGRQGCRLRRIIGAALTLSVLHPVPSTMSDAAAADLIAALGQAIGIPGLRPDARGCCRLMFDGEQIVELQPAPAQGRWLVSCVLRSSQHPDGQALRTLMQGNHLGAGFGGGWAGLDSQGCAVVHLPVSWQEASASALLQAIELVLQHAERWQKRLQDAPPAPLGQSAAMMNWAQRI